MSSETPGARPAAPNWQALLAAVCFAQAAAIVGFDFTLPFIPLYLQHDLGVHGLGQTALWAGLIGFGPAIPATIFGPLWGRVADRFGYRVMLLRAMISASVLLTLMGLVGSPWLLLALRMVQGSLTGTIFSAQALVASAVPENETGRAMGLLQMSVFVGATFGPVGGGATAQALGFRAPFMCAGILLATAAVIVFTFVREPARRHSRQTAETQPRPSMRSVALAPAFAAALVLTLVIQLANTSLFPIIPLFVRELLGTAHGVATDTGWLMAVSGMAAAAGSYIVGRLQRYVALKTLLITCVLLTACLLLPQAGAHSYTAFLVFRSLAAFCFGGLAGLVGTLAAKSSPRDAKGTAFGLIGAASSLGFGAGPLLGGGFAAAFGIRPLFVAAAAVLALFPIILLSLFATVSPASGERRMLPVAWARLRR